ncbi:hypothetical protein SSP35_21_00590 [Streptomyces sp. NBRC 110611]|nr:hypothetical protein SSP35_21_00590 [Streptomyces sp. NBRC 110611]
MSAPWGLAGSASVRRCGKAVMVLAGLLPRMATRDEEAQVIGFSETVAVQTVEEFLTPDEAAQLVKIIDAHPRESGLVHRRAPEEAQEILQHAVHRSLPVIPSAPPLRAGVRTGSHMDRRTATHPVAQ